LLITGAVAFALIRYERVFLIAEGDKRVRMLAENLALNARDPVLVRDELRLGPIIQSVMKDPDAVYALVVDHDRTIVYHPNTQLIGRTWADSARDRDDVLEATVPIVAEDTTVGMAIVGLDSAFIEQAVAATARGLLLPFGAGSIFALVGIFVLTGLHVRRIETLEHAVRALGAGDRLVYARVSGNDEVSRLAGHFNDMVGMLEEARSDIERGFTETVSALATAIEAKDEYTRGHCDRVARVSRTIAGAVGVNDAELRDIELASILHDVGKIGIDARILGKAGKLKDSEMIEIKHHAVIGARILASLSFLARVATYVKHHHEEFDGSGYPDGLAGDQIPLPSRIIHLVDAWDAMTTDRPYRQALSNEEAVARIETGSATEFDPELVEIFLFLERQGVVDSIRRQVDQRVAT
jgi:putative nucleotidyltransferase with HDIG domain